MRRDVTMNDLGQKPEEPKPQPIPGLPPVEIPARPETPIQIPEKSYLVLVKG